MIEEMPDIWSLLEISDTTTDQLKVREVTGFELTEGRVLFGLDAHRHRHLLIPVSQNIRVSPDRQSSGVQIIAHPLIDDGVLKSFVDLVCLKPHLQELFSVIVTEVLETLEKDLSRPDQICHQVLNRWRELLEREPSGILSLEKLVGLFGELWFLREMAQRSSNAVRYWTGPRGARHDFSIRERAVEVKATLTRHGRFVEIHGHDQLEAPENGKLYLTVLKLEHVPDAGETLPELVESIVQIGGDRHTLLNLLARIDTSLLLRDEYRDIRFRLYENRIYEVNDDFPHITSSSFVAGVLPQGVIKLSYQIDLSNEPPVPLYSSAVTQLLAELASLMDV